MGVTLHRNLCSPQEKPNLEKMFAVHLLAFYFTKLKEDQIKKVSTLRAERYLVLSSLIELTDPYTGKDLRELISMGTRHTGED